MECVQSPAVAFDLKRDPSARGYHGASALNEPRTSSVNLRLIEAVRDIQCLYDAKHRLYRSADHKMKVWNHLVHSLKFDGDAGNLCNRWKQLRDKYGKEKKKMRCTGVQSNWRYFRHLKFLDPHMMYRNRYQFARAEDGVELPLCVEINNPVFPSNLIREVQRYPCLYNIRDSNYRHTECRTQAWNTIIETLDFPGDVGLLYKQWKNIRDRYVREKRKLKMSNTAGGEMKEPQWKLFPEMTWIDPYLDDRAMHIKRKRQYKKSMDDSDMEQSIEGRDVMHHSLHSLGKVHQPGSTHTSEPIHYIYRPDYVESPSSQALGDHVVQPKDLLTLNGDKSFALSVVSDLLRLPEPARSSVKAQILSMVRSRRNCENRATMFEQFELIRYGIGFDWTIRIKF